MNSKKTQYRLELHCEGKIFHGNFAQLKNLTLNLSAYWEIYQIFQSSIKPANKKQLKLKTVRKSRLNSTDLEKIISSQERGYTIPFLARRYHITPKYLRESLKKIKENDRA